MVKSGDNLPWLENEVFLELSESHSPSPESTRVNSFSSLDFPDSSLSSGISSKHDKSRDLRHDPWGLGGYTILGINHHSVADLDIWFTKSLFSLLGLYWDCIASECVRVRAHDPIVVTTFHLVKAQVLCSGALQCLHPVSAAAGLQCLHGHIVQLQQCRLSSCHASQWKERNCFNLHFDVYSSKDSCKHFFSNCHYFKHLSASASYKVRYFNVGTAVRLLITFQSV